MKKVRLMTSAAMLAMAGLTVTMTSCSKDEQVCAVGTEGKNCEDLVKEKYFTTYRGSGYDNFGDTYTNWGVKFSNSTGSNVEMRFHLVDENDNIVVNTTAVLKTNTTFELTTYTDNFGIEYSGRGSVNENSASLELTEKESGQVTIYTFNNMSR